MGLVQRIIFLVGAAVAIGLALWVSITIFAFLLIAGGIAVIAVAGRDFLTRKGILNPQPGVRPEQAEAVTVIEGEFEQIENPMVRGTEKQDSSDKI